MEKQNRIFSGFDADAIDRTTAADLAEVGSDKWTRYPGCIGAFIAEMDYGLAPCIQQAIDSACDHCKLGYIPEPWKRRVAETCVVSRSRLPSSTGPVESRANLPGPSGKPKYICLTDSVLVP